MAEDEIREKQKASKAREIVRGIFRHENAVLGIILIGLIGVFAVLSKGYALNPINVRSIMMESATRGVAAIGQAFVILTAGIDLSVGGMALFALCLGTVLIVKSTHIPNPFLARAALAVGPTMAIMLLVGMGIGATAGLSVSRIKLPPLIVTLALWGMLRGAAYQVTGGYNLYLPVEPEVAFVGQGRIAGVPVPVIIFVVGCVIAYFVLNYTTFGRSIYAVGGNPVSAWLSGVNVRNILFWVYVISGFSGALAGLIIMSRTLVANIASVYALELDAIASVIIGGVSLAGGRGTIIGVIMGIIMIGVINNGMTIMVIPPALQDVVKGAIIYIAVTIDYIRRR